MLEVVIFMEVFMSVMMLLILLRQNQMKKQIDAIIKEVEDYVSFITENPEEENYKKDIQEIGSSEKRREMKSWPQSGKHYQELSENQLIQEVLGEYFP